MTSHALLMLLLMLAPLLIVWIAGMLINRLAFDAMLSRGQLCTPSPDPQPVTSVCSAKELFKTDELCWASGMLLKSGQRYLIEIRIEEGWLDRSERADVAGFPTDTWVHAIASPLRRRWGVDWFRPIARVGARGHDEHVLEPIYPFERHHYPSVPDEPGPRTEKIAPDVAARLVEKYPTPPGRTTLVAEFEPSSSGELFLYVNDAVLGLPRMAGKFYRNNRGTARVMVSTVVPETADIKPCAVDRPPGKKRLFVCCDGTWNSAVDTKYGMPVPTNVLKFYNSIRDGDVGTGADKFVQLRYYHRGVGAQEGLFARVLDGATGGGLSKNIMSAYHWLCSHYEDGDEIFIVGFSRGAFTARSLAGMLHYCALKSQGDWAHTRQMWRQYSRRDPDGGPSKPALTAAGKPVSIKFLGVWDTVGALGVPRQYDLLGFFDRKYRFHDTSLSPIVDHAYHALALDEQRNNFFPTLWTNAPAQNQTLEQVWFTGVHSDVGGGYNDRGLSDITLKWMLDKARDCGAILDDEMVKQIEPNARGVLHDSLSPLYRWIGYQPRSVPPLDAHNASQPFGQRIAPEALDRLKYPPISQAPYRTTLDAAHPNGCDVAVYADSPWNWSGIYLTGGEVYEFRVHGNHTWGTRVQQCDAWG